MSSAGVGPFCFLKTNITAPIYQEILEHFMLPSVDQLFKDADLIFQQDLAPAHTAKSTKSWLNEWCWCAWLASKLTRPEPQREYMLYCQEENEKLIPPQQCHKLIPSMPRWIEAVIQAKGAPTKYWVQIQYINILFRSLQFTKKIVLLVLWSILISWDSELVFFC